MFCIFTWKTRITSKFFNCIHRILQFMWQLSKKSSLFTDSTVPPVHGTEIQPNKFFCVDVATLTHVAFYCARKSKTKTWRDYLYINIIERNFPSGPFTSLEREIIDTRRESSTEKAIIHRVGRVKWKRLWLSFPVHITRCARSACHWLWAKDIPALLPSQ